MKILHVTSDDKPGGIQKAFNAYLSVLNSIPQFENLYFSPRRMNFNQQYKSSHHIKMSWFQKMFIRNGFLLPIKQFQNPPVNISFVHNGFICKVMKGYSNKVIGICHNDKPEQFKHADFLICLSPEAVEKAKNIGRNHNSIFHLPHYFEPQKKVSHRGKQKQKLTIGAAGRFVEKKGFKTFIDVAARIKQQFPEVDFVLAGDGPLSKSLRKHSENKGNPVRFSGWIDIEEFAPSIDIFCLPSLDEPFGYILPEIMQFGVAIVASSTNGPLWICKDNKNALFFEPLNCNEMLMCLKTLIQNPKERNKYQQRAKQVVREKRFSKKVFIEKLVSIIQKVK